MRKPTSREQPRGPDTAPKKGPKIVRADEVTPGTEVANLPRAEDEVDEALEEIFPASEPPSYSGRREKRLESATGKRG